jgi:hypothetical protein
MSTIGERSFGYASNNQSQLCSQRKFHVCSFGFSTPTSLPPITINDASSMAYFFIYYM